jgi:hypothetical protein
MNRWKEITVITPLWHIVNSGYNGYDLNVPSDKPFLSFIVDPEMIKRLDDFRFKHRFESRAAAIKWLLDWALTQKPKPPQPLEREKS